MRRTPILAAAPEMTEAEKGAALRSHKRNVVREGGTVVERDANGRSVGTFAVGKLLGRGGFAKCFEFIRDNTSYACKVIERSSLQQTKTLQKLHSEIAIHSRMKHRNIVNFIRTFQDETYVYILLEKCDGTTLMDVAKRHPQFSVPEVQFIMLQTLAALQYMHNASVIHRDLKLGNMMLDTHMNVKIGDFGLAAQLEHDGERKRTMCGTPNYIAPEIINGKMNGHSFEVDVWSFGVIMYTLLVGQPPFQTHDVKTTYNRIKECRYGFPPTPYIPESAKELINSILRSQPHLRPTLIQIRSHPFFKFPVPPTSAPLSLFPEQAIRHMTKTSHPDFAAVAEGHPHADRRPSNGIAGRPEANRDLSPREALRQMSPNRIDVRGGAGKSAGDKNRHVRESERETDYPRTTRAPVDDAGYHRAPHAAQPDPRNRHHRVGGSAKLEKMSDNVHPTGSEDEAQDFNGNVPGNGRGEALDEEEKQHLTVLHDQLCETFHGDREDDNNEDEKADIDTHGVNRNGETAALPRVRRPSGQSAATRVGTATSARTYGDRQAVRTQQPSSANGHGSRRGSGVEEERATEAEAPLSEEAAPNVWVTDFADFSAKYGMAYKLSTGHTGVHFNDLTKMVWEPITGQVEYYKRQRSSAQAGPVRSGDVRESFIMDNFPPDLKKKVTLTKYFKSYLAKVRTIRDDVKVIKCSPYLNPQPALLTMPNMVKDMVYVKRWFDTPDATIFRLSDRTIQICFKDMVEIIFKPEFRAATYTNADGQRRAISMSNIANQPEEISSRLRHTKDILCKLIRDRAL